MPPSKTTILAALRDLDRVRDRLIALLDEVEDKSSDEGEPATKRDGRLTEAGVALVRQRFARGSTIVAIAKELGISRTAVRHHIRKLINRQNQELRGGDSDQ